jgi:2-polyprenylphenol 6-hydroxylase
VVALSRFDVLVVGGGPVGWACALAAKTALSKGGHRSPSPPRVGVIDTKAALAISEASTSKSSPMGARVYTVTHENLSWLSAHGIALDRERSADVTNIVVHTQDGAQALDISARDARVDRVAAVVEHDWLAVELARAAMKHGVQAINARVASSDLFDGTRFIELEDRSVLSASLVIISQGAGSALADQIGIKTLSRDYARFGVIANFTTTDAHRGAARQWFLPDQSVLALLPLPRHTQQHSPHDGQHAVSMVWSVDAARCEALRAMTEAELCAAVSAASGMTLSAVSSSAQSFPLRLSRTANPVAERALVVGDSAHAIHPLAGQGVNLGLADAQALEQVLAKASSVGGDAGHALLLSRYRRLRYAPTLVMQATTDGLARIYNQESRVAPGILANLADGGMRILGRVPTFRRMLSSAAH